MKKINYIIAALGALALVFSCEKEAPVGQEPVNPTDNETPAVTEPVTISASLSEALTKVAFDPAYEGGKPTSMALTWAKEDKIRVYDHSDRSKYEDFTLDAASVGKKDGVFTGTPISATTYDAEVINGSLDYAAQTQPSDGVTTGLKYLASAENIADYASIDFTDFSSVLAITAKMPSTEVAAVIKSVDITASDNIFNGGNSLTITLDAAGDKDADGILNFYATMPKGSKSITAGTTLLVHFNAPGEAHDVYTRYIELPASSFTANKLNTININASASATHAGLTSCDGSTSAKAYLIGDKYQLAAISDELSTTEKKYFKLVDDITVTSWTRIDCNAKGAIELNGNNKTISGLNDALFEFLDGKVENLNIDNANITAGSYYGILVRSIKKPGCVISKVNVSNSSLSGAAHLGGLVGFIDASSCEVSECSTDVAVSGNSYNYGGLVGYARNGTFTITGCSATGNVASTRGSDYTFVGGLIGCLEKSSCSITKCNYSTGTVSSNAPRWPECGGLIGDFKNGSLLTIEKSYFDGTVHGAEGTGGLIGQIEGSPTVTIRDCYVSGSIDGTGKYAGGFLGLISSTATINVINSYSNASVTGAKWSACVFAGGNDTKIYPNLTCTGVVGWNTSNRVVWIYDATVAPSGNYMGTEGSVYFQAVALGGWDFENVWTTDPTPKLRK